MTDKVHIYDKLHTVKNFSKTGEQIPEYHLFLPSSFPVN